jgi:tryptophanyl-tRNA synthetase
MRIVTDSTPMEDPKDPDNCNVFALLKLFADEDELTQWRDKYQAGGMGYGTVKKRLVELVHEYFQPYRQKRADLENNHDYVEKVLADGAQRARAVAAVTLDKVRKAVGL